jgi:formylglycine-generating enzyme required for sulfatase activity
MGSRNGFIDERPLREVEIISDLTVSKFEVTNALWQLVMKDQIRRNEDSFKPAVNLSWEDAIKFCNKASEIDGLDLAYSIEENTVVFNQKANGWRLPTEAEWEYLAKARSDYDFAGSNEINDVAWFNQNSGFNLQKVGIKLANENGLYDMNGNALEWCWDFYQRYEPSTEAIRNPLGPETGDYHVRRGGAINLPIVWCRNTTRNFSGEGLQNTGFRIVRNN